MAEGQRFPRLPIICGPIMCGVIVRCLLSRTGDWGIAVDRGYAVDGGYEVVTSGKELALRITAAGRTRPAAVISWHPDQGHGRIDIDHIVREVGGLADIFSLESGPETYAFGDGLPAGAHVFGNAARVYSTDLRWMKDIFRSRLHLASDKRGAERAADAIIEDVLSQIGSVPPKPAPIHSAPRQARGTIKAFASSGSRAIVELDDGTRCTIQREHVVPPVRIDWMLFLGQRVEGDFNDQDKTLDINRLKSAPRLAELYQQGDLVLALAEAVCATSAKLTLYPGSSWAVPLARISSNPHDTVDSLVTEGEVVVARFLREQGAVVLSLIDVDDDAEVKPAPALLAGGTPWLVEGRHLSEQATSGTTFAAAVPDPRTTDGDRGNEPAGTAPKPTVALLSVQLQLEAERRRVAELQGLVSASSAAGARLVGLQQELDAHKLELAAERRNSEAARTAMDQAGARLETQRAELQRLRTNNRDTQRALKRAATESEGMFATADERLRHDIYLAWAKNVPPADKAARPLPATWTSAPEFVDTVYACTEPGLAAKALKTIVEVLTGSAEHSPSREVHPLRENMGAESAQVKRGDGARCFRAAIERNVAAARRLHFWRLPDGTVELSRIVVHDDYRP
jgi:hypothetical protein